MSRGMSNIQQRNAFTGSSLTRHERESFRRTCRVSCISSLSAPVCRHVLLLPQLLKHYSQRANDIKAALSCYQQQTSFVRNVQSTQTARSPVCLLCISHRCTDRRAIRACRWDFCA